MVRQVMVKTRRAVQQGKQICKGVGKKKSKSNRKQARFRKRQTKIQTHWEKPRNTFEKADTKVHKVRQQTDK